MIVDCHVHIAANSPGCGAISPRLLKAPGFRFLRWWFAMKGTDAQMQQKLADVLSSAINRTPELDAAVVLAFDAVYDNEGRMDPQNTHLHVTNDYVIDLSKRYRKMLFGASVHPYRRDAVAETERCIHAGAVLMKWLPVTHNFDPADRRCIPVYEAMAHYRLPLLCHTGWERMLVTTNTAVADPLRLREALKRGVTVIAAHCGTRSAPWETDYLPNWTRMAREYEHFYGDTAALNLPSRWYAYDVILRDRALRSKLVHGSDWPIMPWPVLTKMDAGSSRRLLFEGNWMRRDILIKKRLGLAEDYLQRGGGLLRLA